MLKNLFSNRLFIGVLVLLICAVSLYFLRPGPDVPDGPVVIYKTTEPLSTSEKTQVPEGEAIQPPVVDTSEAVHSQSDERQTEPHEAQKTDTARPFTPEELVAMEKAFYTQQGLEPPPKGYQYLFDAPGQVRVDEAGNPVLHKIGDPVITIHIETGFAPTREQLQQYDQLIDDHWQAEQVGDTARAAEIADEIQRLEKASQGDKPRVSHSLLVPEYMDYDEAKKRADMMANEALNNALREMGLEHLIPENRFPGPPEE